MLNVYIKKYTLYMLQVGSHAYIRTCSVPFTLAPTYPLTHTLDSDVSVPSGGERAVADHETSTGGNAGLPLGNLHT